MRLITLLLVLALPLAASGQELIATELSSDTISILEGRVVMTVLEGGELEARGHSIMAAAPQNATESRIRIDGGDERMVVMAYELFSSCGPSFGESVAASLEPLGDAANVRPVAEAGGLEFVLYTPTERNLTSEAVHVGTGFVCTADRHVVRLDFLISPAGTEDMPALEGRVSDMLETLESGDRSLNVAARTVSMGEGLELPLPAGIYHYAQEGPDFLVNFLGEIGTLGESNGTVLFYIGGHPTRRHESAPDVLATLFGSDVLWSVEERNGRASQEALVPHPSSEFTILHVLISSEDQETSSALRVIIEGVSLEP
ncbi:MAG: hypothetical protein ACJAYU_003294 [Bradymonadia bacterium]|jgi:hypothetical protein